MILRVTTFTFVHVVISLLGILSGLVVLFGLIQRDGTDAIRVVASEQPERPDRHIC